MTQNPTRTLSRKRGNFDNSLNAQINLPEPHTTLKVESVSESTYHLAEPLRAELAETARYVLAEGPAPADWMIEWYAEQEIGPPAVRPRTGFEIEAATVESIIVRDYPVIDCDEIILLHSKWLHQ